MKRRRRSGRAAIACGLLMLLAGCTGGDSMATARTEPAPPGPAALEAANPTELAATIAANRGQVVLVDFWATWCTTCVEMMPHVAELQGRFGSRGLVVVGLCVNDADEAVQAARALEKIGRPLRSYISRQPSTQETFAAFALQSVPTYRLYDSRGQLRHTFPVDGQLNAAELDRAVEELLDAGD